MKSIFYIALFYFFTLASSLAQSPIDLTQHTESSFIGKHISYFEDKGGNYSIGSIVNSPDELFTENKEDIINFGFSPSVFWLKFSIKKSADTLKNWILEIKAPELDSVTFYYQDKNGSWKEKSDGDNWSFYKREINSRNIAFKLSETQNDSVYYIKIRSIGPITIPVKIETYDFFVSENLSSELFFGICYGILFIMFFYNLFIFFSTRELSYFYYVLSVTFGILFYGIYYGHIPQYITHYKAPVLNNLLSFISIIWSIFILQFVKTFLNFPKISIVYNRLINGLQFLSLLNLLVLFFIGPGLSLMIVLPLVLISSITVLIASFSCIRKGNREARFFILGWGFYLCAIIIFVLRLWSVIPNYEFILNVMLIGSVVEVSLQSFALADKINIYRKQKELAQEQIIKIQEQDAAVLEQKVAERTLQLQNANDEISMVNKDLDTFSRYASHDLRSPLNSIIGYTRLIEEDQDNVLSKDSREFLSVIQKSSKGMNQLMEDLMSFSRLGKQELKKEELNMKDLFEKVITELVPTRDKDQKINIKLGNIINAYGDAGLLKQVLINLISNAIKFSSKEPKTEIEINSETKDDYVIYSVKDNGVGFDMKYVDRLFQSFQRFHGQSEFEGTGLGLSIVKKIISKHGGEAWAHSIVGEGATFYFSLPKTK